EVRKPLTDWEEAEKARIDTHNRALQHIKTLGEMSESFKGETLKSNDLTDFLKIAQAIAIDERWEEFEAEAARAKDYAINQLRAAIVLAEKAEAEAAEAERL